MDAKESPLVVPALGLVAGTCLAGGVSSVPMVVGALLVALGIALRRPSGLFVAFLVLGLWNAGARWIDPADELRDFDLARPVEIVARTTSHPSPGGHGTELFRVRTLHLRQSLPRSSGARRLLRAACDVWVTAPGAAPRLGTTVRLRGYLRRSAGYVNSPHVVPGPWRLRLKSLRFLEVEERPGAVMRLAARLRSGSEEALEAAETEGRGGLALARALLLGDRSRLPVAWPQVLRRLGLAHLLAVSGLHVGLLAVLALAVATPLPRRFRYLAALLAVVLYLLLIGPRPAVLRATIMGLLALSALLLERPPQAANALAACVLVLVADNPAVAMQLGFQLSCAATAGIVVLSPVFCERWTALPPWLRRPLAASVAAQLLTFPLLVEPAGTWHPLAVFFNLAAIPWLAVFLGFAFFFLAAAAISAPLGAALVPVLDFLAAPLGLAASLPPTSAALRLVSLSPGLAWALAATLAAAGCRPRQALAVALAAALLLLTGAPAPTARSAPRLVMLDVGQGDATLLEDGGRAVLIDGGGWPRGDLGGRVLLPALARAGVRRLDAVVLTHPDLDHCGGLADLVRYLPVSEVWTPPGDFEEACAVRLLAAPGPRRRVLVRGDVVDLGRWRLRVLHPEAGDRGPANDLSLVLMAEVASSRVLLTGDLEAAGERLLLRRGAALQADVLKVAHHGSKTSTTAAWLRAVRPRIALISAGRSNPYGHPAPPVIERLDRARIRVLRTDRSGRVDLTFADDGRIVFAAPFAPPG